MQCIHSGRYTLNLNGPGADHVVGVAGVEGVTVGGPGNASALGRGLHRHLGHELHDLGLRLQVVHVKVLVGGNAHPEAVGGEGDLVDGGLGVDLEEGLTAADIPEASKAVLTASGAQRTIGGHGDGAHVVGVLVLQGVQAGAGLKVPDLRGAVPAAGEDLGGANGGEEADAAHPVAVARKLRHAGALNVPHADHVIATTRHDLAVVGRERDGEHILGVLQELGHGVASAEVPQAKRAVPGTSHGVGVVGKRDGGHEAGVALQAVVGESDGVRTAVVVGVGLPRDRGAIAGGGHHQKRAASLLGARQGSDPAAVTLELTFVVHVVCVKVRVGLNNIKGKTCRGR